MIHLLRLLFSVLFLLVCSLPTSSRASTEERDPPSPFSVLFENGIKFEDSSRIFSSTLRFRIQNRADFLVQQIDDPENLELNTEWQVRRARLRFNGHLVDPRLRYSLQLSFSRRDQDWDESQFPHVLRDAMVFYDITPSWQVSFGQGKLPGNRQRVVSSGELQFVDRSIVNAAFNIDRDFGFQTQYRANLGERARAILKGSVTSGEGRNRSVKNDGRLFTVGRVEVLPMGEFQNNGDYYESDLAFESDLKLSLALTYASLAGAARANGTVGEIFTTTGAEGDPWARRDQQVLFLDAMAKWEGFSLLTEYARRWSLVPEINDSQSLLVGSGLNFQFGKMISERREFAFRFATVTPDPVSKRDHDEIRDWAVVFNQFLNGHRVKLQSEVGLQERRQAYLRLQVELGI